MSDSRWKMLRRLSLCLLLTSLSFASTSCGGSERETVYLFVINGYAAAESIDVYGPRGPLVQELAFGERTPEPIKIDRSTGTNFTVVIKGAPSPVELQLDLFNFYPQETGTLFVKKRDGDDSAALSLYRHVQSIDPSCAITFENGLSTGNDFLTISSFSFAPEFNLETAENGGYFEETQESVLTECGPLPTPTPSPIPRPDLKQRIDEEPWFFLGDCQSTLQDNLVCPVWGQLSDENGSVVGAKPTISYFECVEQAITIKQPEGAMPSPFPAADSQVQCPDGALMWDDVQVDDQAVRECKALDRFTVSMLNPGSEKQTYSLTAAVDLLDQSDSPLLRADDEACEIEFRIRTPRLDTIFGPQPGSSEPGSHGSGGLVVSNIRIPIGAEHFFVIFGRPINPLVWQWNSSENFVNLEEFPYLNDQNRNIDREAFDSEPQ